MFFRILTDNSSDRFLSSWHKCRRGWRKGSTKQGNVCACTESAKHHSLKLSSDNLSWWKEDGDKGVCVCEGWELLEAEKQKSAGFTQWLEQVFFSLLCIHMYSCVFSWPTRQCTKILKLLENKYSDNSNSFSSAQFLISMLKFQTRRCLVSLGLVLCTVSLSGPQTSTLQYWVVKVKRAI